MDKNNYEIKERLLYIGNEGAYTIEAIIDNGKIMANLNQLSSLFGIKKSDIKRHIKNIFEDGELIESLTVAKYPHVFNESNIKVEKLEKFYNLDMIISLSYRIKSQKSIQFRRGLINILKEYIVKGHVLDKDLLINGTRFGEDYFDRLLEEIQEIRLSKRSFEQKLTDLYTTSYDYKNDAKITREFYIKVYKLSKSIFNKMDTDKLNQIINQFLDLALELARTHKPMAMKKWILHFDAILDTDKFDSLV